MGTPPAAGEPSPLIPLTQTEATSLDKCEVIIEKGIKTFVAVGRALLRIRDDRLYRTTYGTFEDYCQQRWQLARTTAYQLVDAARVADAIESRPMSAIADTSPQAEAAPANEAQTRPLTRLLPKPGAPPAEREQAEQTIRETWQEAVITAPRDDDDNPQVTAAHVADTVTRRTAPKPAGPVDRRGPLGDELLKIAIELHRLTNRIDKIRGDDRFNRNTQKIAIRLRPDLRRAVQIYQGLLDALPDTTEDITP